MRTPPPRKQESATKRGAKTRLHLRKGRKIGKELREVAALQLDAAIKELKRGKVSPESIHHARTYIKKLRAIIQLSSPVLPRHAMDRQQELLKKAASKMSRLRDADVGLQTLDLIIQESGAPVEQFSSLRGGIADVAKQHRANGSKQIPHVLGFLRTIRKSISAWPLDELSSKDIQRRIKRTYRRGRTSLDLCSSTKNPDDFHLWRKQVKQLWYQLRLTSLHWPDKAEKLIAATGEIGHLAGMERDCMLLAATLEKGPHSKSSGVLREKIAKRLPTLRSKAISAGELFYSKKPKAFVEDLDL